MKKAGLNQNVEGRTLLMHAAFEGDLEGVLALLREGSDPNARDEGGDTALMFAALGGHFLVVKTLLAHGADPLASANNGWTALQAARSRRHADVAELLERAEKKSV
jgi:ankyrin repeat protein